MCIIQIIFRIYIDVDMKEADDLLIIVKLT